MNGCCCHCPYCAGYAAGYAAAQRGQWQIGGPHYMQLGNLGYSQQTAQLDLHSQQMQAGMGQAAQQGRHQALANGCQANAAQAQQDCRNHSGQGEQQ